MDDILNNLCLWATKAQVAAETENDFTLSTVFSLVAAGFADRNAELPSKES